MPLLDGRPVQDVRLALLEMSEEVKEKILNLGPEDLGLILCSVMRSGNPTSARDFLALVGDFFLLI